MLEQALKDQLKGIFAALKSNFTLKIEVDSNHPGKDELIALLDDVASTSDKISTQILNGDALQFSIIKNGEPAAFVFKAIPNGHEFTSLLLALLNLDGIGKNLPDETIITRIKAIKQPVTVKSYISLTCTNCPDVVQALNIISIYNPLVTHYIIDGGIHQSEVEQLNIQAVPSVYVNDTLMHVGRSSLGELIEKLEQVSGTEFIAGVLPERKYDLVVAGGGPAGVSAAIYAARKGFTVAIIAEKIGGQVTETQGIENLISVTVTSGPKLSGDLRKHLGEYAVDIFENRMVTDARLENGIKYLTTSLGETFSCEALIIATGASWRRLNVPGENEYIGSGVAFCTHCDGPFYKNKKVAVIGGGNSGLEAAIDMANIASEVTVIEFLDDLKGDIILQNKLNTFSNVQIIKSAQTLAIQGNGAKVTALEYKHRQSGQTEKIELDGVFVQIGLVPNSKVFANLVETTRFGEIVIDTHGRTNTPGIYAAGDVTTVPYKQIIIAMGEGAKSALAAFDDKIMGKLL